MRRSELGRMLRTGRSAGGAAAARQRERNPADDQGDRRDPNDEQRRPPPPPRAGTALGKHHASHLGSLPSESIRLLAITALSAEHTRAATPSDPLRPRLTAQRGGANTP